MANDVTETTSRAYDSLPLDPEIYPPIPENGYEYILHEVNTIRISLKAVLSGLFQEDEIESYNEIIQRQKQDLLFLIANHKKNHPELERIGDILEKIDIEDCNAHDIQELALARDVLHQS